MAISKLQSSTYTSNQEFNHKKQLSSTARVQSKESYFADDLKLGTLVGAATGLPIAGAALIGGNTTYAVAGKALSVPSAPIVMLGSIAAGVAGGMAGVVIGNTLNVSTETAASIGAGVGVLVTGGLAVALRLPLPAIVVAAGAGTFAGSGMAAISHHSGPKFR